MKRILITLSYDGTAYAGWQRQLNGIAIQQVVEEALEKATGAPVKITGASRTDAGVHALGQAAHFDTESTIPPEKYPFVLNTLLPEDIRVLAGQEVGETFHARFDTKGKRYLYHIHNAPHAGALNRRTHVHVPMPLDEAAMHEAAQSLLGVHDFAAFAAAGGSHKTSVREIYEISCVRRGEAITLSVYGNAFLYNMVRIIAGTLIGIGHGKTEPDCFLKALETGDRLCLGITAPAHGLILDEVFYEA